ncbi:MAG: BREX system P-loop protein BrxC [Planctomycetota bacterium]|jgi:hypothetical protein|nr:BREX system P-loop protein BrxC [Planctomycetota bacterium]
MLNRELYLIDPASRKLVNEGVAKVDDQAEEVLRYELDTFVCDGQYEKGLRIIIETFCNNINQAQQPGVWVSGFFGSGKSHLMKILQALWNDRKFKDGAIPSGLATLPTSVTDGLRELKNQGKRHGGLHAVAGSIRSGAAGSARLALLAMVFKSAGLPESYPVACFVLWLMKEGLHEDVRRRVEADGYDWDAELSNFHVAQGLYQVLCAVRPAVFPAAKAVSDIMPAIYPHRTDISNGEMVEAIRQALARGGKFPLTLLVLDELQQYIGDNADRSAEVQEIVETCSKSFRGKLMFAGAGQTAIVGTPNLHRLEGRFTVRIELSDADVDAVIRKVVLAKKPGAETEIEQFMQSNLGEISRHLSGAGIGFRQEDMACLALDYPLLPVRKRFWEQALRALDATGVQSQLRNQLKTTFQVVLAGAKQPLGRVAPADFLYFDCMESLLQASLLSRDIYDQIRRWRNSSREDEQLAARAAALVFLINKLAAANPDLGVKADPDSLADLLVEDLAAGSASLRARLPDLLDNCELLIKVGDAYRIQTPESAIWNAEFAARRSALANEGHRLEQERENRLRLAFGKHFGNLERQHGTAKVKRVITPVFDPISPRDDGGQVRIWVRDGWSVGGAKSVEADARAAGERSPIIFVFIAKDNADALRQGLIDSLAAAATLAKFGAPALPDGQEARQAMETLLWKADQRVDDCLDRLMAQSRIYQGGGAPADGRDAKTALDEAIASSLERLYPEFRPADHLGWEKVYAKARGDGSPDALRAVGYEGEPGGHPVCKKLLGFIGAGKTGQEIRSHFEAPPHGWPADAIDGALWSLWLAGLVSARDDRHAAPDPRQTERRAAGKLIFKTESATVNARQNIEIRQLFQVCDIHTPGSGEAGNADAFIKRLLDLADAAGGEAPKPEKPDISRLDQLRQLSGNALLLGIHQDREELQRLHDEWQGRSLLVEKRWPEWLELSRLREHAKGLAGAGTWLAQMDAVVAGRQLLNDPNPLAALRQNLAQRLRDELNRLSAAYADAHGQGLAGLARDPAWTALPPEEQKTLLARYGLNAQAKPALSLGSPAEILSSLDACPLLAFEDRVAALPGRFSELLKAAASLREPRTQFVPVIRRTLRDAAEIDAWAEEMKNLLRQALRQGPARPE